jgi:hypothetical protein
MLLSSTDPIKISGKEIYEYQITQLKHDKAYHREIWVLGVVRGMNHVVLHLMKYLARLGSFSIPDSKNKQAFVDSFIMIVSAGNLLNLSFSKLIYSSSTEDHACRFDGDFIKDYIDLLAEMAKACEATDHQEDYPIRVVWNNSVEKFFVLLVLEAEKRGINIVTEARNRLLEVESSHALNEIFQENVW